MTPKGRKATKELVSYVEANFNKLWERGMKKDLVKMTPAEFKANRIALKLSHAQLGRILNTDPRTVRYWEDASGQRPPNPIACRAMEWMLNGYRPPEFPKKPVEPFHASRI